MFVNFPAEVIYKIFSFLNNREVARLTTVNKLSNLAANAIFEIRIKDCKRDDLKQMSLATPKLAHIGVQVDANRGRYLLSVNDLREIGLTYEAVAAFMVGCTKLHNRLSRDCLSEFCIAYPKVGERILNMPEIRGRLTKEDIVEIIKAHPTLFNIILQQDSLTKKISNQITLNEIAALNEDFALAIIKHAKLKKEIYIDSSVWAKYEKVAVALLKDKELYSQLDKESIKRLGEVHIEAAKLIIENPILCAKLKENDLQLLEDKVISTIQFNSLTLN